MNLFNIMHIIKHCPSPFALGTIVAPSRFLLAKTMFRHGCFKNIIPLMKNCSKLRQMNLLSELTMGIEPGK